MGWAEGVVHLLQKGIPYLQNSISQSLLKDFFLSCTTCLYGAGGSPQVGSKVHEERFGSEDTDLFWEGMLKGMSEQGWSFWGIPEDEGSPLEGCVQESLGLMQCIHCGQP